jgi:hypothetical protein
MIHDTCSTQQGWRGFPALVIGGHGQNIVGLCFYFEGARVFTKKESSTCLKSCLKPATGYY